MNIFSSLCPLLMGWLVLCSCNMQAQKTPDLAQVVLNLQNRLQKAQGISFHVESKDGGLSAQVMALRPNYFKFERENQCFYSDGNLMWQYFPLQAVYTSRIQKDKSMNLPIAEGFEMYSLPSDFSPEYRAVEKTVFEGKDVFVLIEEPSDNPNLRIRVFIDPETWLPLGFERKLLDTVNVYIYRNVRTDLHFVPADFAWTPPKGSIDGRKINREDPLLQVGDVAPDFALPLTNGKRLTLNEALEGKKGLLLNFWFINCGYCLSEMPEIAELYRTADDLEVVAINDVDTGEEIRKFVQKPNYRFPVAIDEGAKIAEAYKVKDKGHPVSYLIRPNRTISYVQSGYDEKKLAKLEEELTKLGIRRHTAQK
jgi:outer membrane lipoprotein-sorting protein/peroxiredoxin